MTSWNTASKRALLNALVSYTQKLIDEEEEDESSLSSDDDDYSIGSISFLDSSISSIRSSDSSISTIPRYVNLCVDYANLLYGNENNNYTAMYRNSDMTINDLMENVLDQEIILELRFRKEHLIILAEKL